jgi:hypothetical protein
VEKGGLTFVFSFEAETDSIEVKFSTYVAYLQVSHLNVNEMMRNKIEAPSGEEGCKLESIKST